MILWCWHVNTSVFNLIIVVSENSLVGRERKELCFMTWSFDHMMICSLKLNMMSCRYDCFQPDHSCLWEEFSWERSQRVMFHDLIIYDDFIIWWFDLMVISEYETLVNLIIVAPEKSLVGRDRKELPSRISTSSLRMMTLMIMRRIMTFMLRMMMRLMMMMMVMKREKRKGLAALPLMNHLYWSNQRTGQGKGGGSGRNKFGEFLPGHHGGPLSARS